MTRLEVGGLRRKDAQGRNGAPLADLGVQPKQSLETRWSISHL
jgi:hypothetical protein